MGRKPIKRERRGLAKWLVDRNPIARAVIRGQARKGVDAKAHGNYPAPYAALDLVMAAPGRSLSEAARAEADAVAALATGPVCKSLVGIFFASEAAKKLAKFEDGQSPERVRRAAVVGGGIMGGGIASLMADKKVEVRLADLSRAALDAATWQHRKDIARKRKRRRLSTGQANAAMDRLEVSVGISGVGEADIAIEAVAEVMKVKHAVLGELAGAMPEDAILATNTSSLSVTAMQRALPGPERVVGMHFFNPVKKMPLVEIVRGEETSDATITRTAALAVALGKTPVVTKDVPGFLVNRLLGPYLDEAVRLFVDGVSPVRIDRLLVAFGMPMGPFTLLDEVGFDIAAHAAGSPHEGYARMTPCDALGGMISRTPRQEVGQGSTTTRRSARRARRRRSWGTSIASSAAPAPCSCRTATSSTVSCSRWWWRARAPSRSASRRRPPSSTSPPCSGRLRALPRQLPATRTRSEQPAAVDAEAPRRHARRGRAGSCCGALRARRGARELARAGETFHGRG